jgi:hypothetical protein
VEEQVVEAAAEAGIMLLRQVEAEAPVDLEAEP